MFIFLLFYRTTECDVAVNTVFLVPLEVFPGSAYEGILAGFGESAVVRSVEGFVLTGAEARAKYFPEVHLLTFQLLHLTRVRASVVTTNDGNTSAYLSQLLGPICARRIGPMAFDPPSAPPPFELQIPPSISIATTALWLLTVIAWSVHCIVARCQSEKAVQSADQSDPYVAPPQNLGPAAVRLESWKPMKDLRRL
jgi:hypothetical protein